MSNELATFNFEITSLQQAMEYAKMIADSDLAPKDYKGKPGNVLVAIQYGVEIGLKPMQAIQNIAVINGRPTIYGDAMMALVQNSPLCEYVNESYKDGVAACTVKRRGEDEYTVRFSREDAKKAGLLGKPGPWTQYEPRMLQMRARGFAFRDKFSDVLKGMAMREEVMDYQVTDVTQKQEKIYAANNKVLTLIQSKAEKMPHVTSLIDRINNATSTDELGDISVIVKTLSDADKEVIRPLYKQKREQLSKIDNKSEKVDKETGEITQSSEFDKIKKQLLKATSLDTLQLAADLIQTVEEENRNELYEIYNNRQQEFK